jgi:CMP-N,N'-diacetyllegionaminic acid synthase
MRIVALIPARAGSKRVPGKNTKLLYGKPLIHWTIEAAKESGRFEDVVVCSDDQAALLVGAKCDVIGFQRDPSSDDEPDIAWVRTVPGLDLYDAFAILRPTSPFRTAATIRRAVEQFQRTACSSLRAIERVRQHPGKMWLLKKQTDPIGMTPLLDRVDVSGHPWHSKPTQYLPEVYVQNSSLEIAWTWCVRVFGTISGPKVAPFFTEGMEGFSIDYPDDWERAERYVAHLQATAAAE